MTPSSIIYTDEEELKLKDWMAECKDSIYYANKKRKDVLKDDDFAALGHIIAQATTLKKGCKVFQEKDIHHVLDILIDKYSKGIFFAVAVLLKKNKERYSLLPHYFNNE